jgi:hypothetical protein
MTLSVRPRGAFVTFIYHLLDLILVPFMYLAAGTFSEAPQQTHRWNYTKFRPKYVRERLRGSRAIRICGVSTECDPWWHFIPRFHIPIFGGWRHYVVLTPRDHIGAWHVGWWTRKGSAISRIPLHGPVRMLRGPKDTWFFAVDKDGNQLVIDSLGTDMVGSGGEFSRLPLL